MNNIKLTQQTGTALGPRHSRCTLNLLASLPAGTFQTHSITLGHPQRRRLQLWDNLISERLTHINLRRRIDSKDSIAILIKERDSGHLQQPADDDRVLSI